MTSGLRFIRFLMLPLAFLVVSAPAGWPADPNAPVSEAVLLDRKVIEEAKKGSEALANLTYLCDEIGPRMTGSANLKRANDWAAAKMRGYGLSNVHLEGWSMPEGWERGPAQARIIEPNTGVQLSLAAMGWSPGTEGKVQADVVILKAKDSRELAAYKGKLKGTVVLTSPPQKVALVQDIDRPEPQGAKASGPTRTTSRAPQDMAFYRERSEFLRNEGVTAILMDSAKPLGLLVTTGSWETKDRPSAINRMPALYLAHNHYELLYRLASRPEPARTRIEIEVRNTFVPGPLAVYNTVGEIRGAEKPDELVVVGGHLDSWDLAQGATDNGTGTVTVLEAARILARSGIRPKRTIRFILFTGEEQGLHGSRAYVDQHKEELPRISACLIHDTGTGKVNGIGLRHRPVLRPLLEKELASLHDLGLTDFQAAFITGSDHATFDRAGVPGLMMWQESAGYRLSHHTQADTLDRALEPNLIQGAQVMAVSALRLANRDSLLPREKAEKAAPGKTPKEEGKEQAGEEPREKKQAGRFGVENLGQLVGLSDPQIAPDGRSVALMVSRPNYDKNRSDAELILVDVATGKQRTLSFEREGVSQPRWSPTGDRLAFLARAGSGKEAKHQIFVLPMNGGDAHRITNASLGVQHFSWRPDGTAIAFATQDEPDNKKEIEKGNDAFEVGNDGFLTAAAPLPSHIWLVSAEGGPRQRLTSGSWSLEVAPPPSTPSSPLSWSPDGRSIAFVRQVKPNVGNRDQRSVQVLDVATGKVTPLTGRTSFEGTPTFAPDGSQLVYWYPREGDPMNVNEIWLAPAAGGKGRSLTGELDRCLYQSLWMPDGKAVLVGGNDGSRVSLWLQPLEGPAKKLDLGQINPYWAYRLDASVSPTGAIAFTGTQPDQPAELYIMESVNSGPRKLTDFNREVASLDLGKVESMSWNTADGFKANGILTYPPGFAANQKYPLVLLIHGGPASASTEKFSLWPQLIAARGNVVFEPNYRGSDNLGNAYQRAIFKDQGDGPGKDVMAGLEALKKRGFVEEKRIAVTGWSYGGYMTSWLIGHYPIWKTAIAGAAVTDLGDQYNLSDGNVSRRHSYGGSPWVGDNEKRMREQSPISYAHNIRTPTLILSTTGDARVPITQSYRLYHALQDNGVPVKFVAYPVPGHFPADPVRQRDVYRRWVDWLDEHLK